MEQNTWFRMKERLLKVEMLRRFKNGNTLKCKFQRFFVLGILTSARSTDINAAAQHQVTALVFTHFEQESPPQNVQLVSPPPPQIVLVETEPILSVKNLQRTLFNKLNEAANRPRRMTVRKQDVQPKSKLLNEATNPPPRMTVPTQDVELPKSKLRICTLCPVGEAKLMTRRSLSRHMKLKHGTPEQRAEITARQPCPVCGKMFRIKYLQVHMNVKHQASGEEEVAIRTCDMCHKVLSCKASLEQHRKLHEGPLDRPHMCEVCGKAFSQKGSVLDHKDRVHLKIKNFACDKCPGRFFDRTTLRIHMQRRHTEGGEPRVPCPVCGKMVANLYNHRRLAHVAMEDRRFVCDICEKRFATKTHLNGHIRLHTGEKPFCCEFCDACFAHNTSLRVHKAAHHGIRPKKRTN